MKSRLLRSTFLFGMMLSVLTPISVDAETWTDHWAIIDIMEGETRTLYPTDAQISLMTQYDNEEVLSWSWTKNNDNITIVSKSMTSCTIKGVKSGSAQLDFQANMLNKYWMQRYTMEFTYYINVKKDVKVSSISISPSPVFLSPGDNVQLKATVLPYDANNREVTWSSSAPEIVTISNAGLLSAKAKGTATITCRATDGSGVTGTCEVTVRDKVPVTDIVLSETELGIKVGKTTKVQAVINPTNATDKSITWSSSDPEIATVRGYDNSDGTAEASITGKAEGMATITCSSNDGSGVKSVCTVKVNKYGVGDYFRASTPEGVELRFRVMEASCCVVDNGFFSDAFPESKKEVTKLTIPETVEGMTVIGIEGFAFYGWEALTSVSMPKTVKSLGQQAFYACKSLSTITGISNLEYIGISVFSGAGSSFNESIPWYNSLPDGLLYLGKVLYGYKGTMQANTTLNVKEGTTQLGGEGFGGQDGLVAINVPNSVVTVFSIGDCKNLKSITVASDNPVFDSRNNCNAIIETATNTLVVGCMESTIPSTVTAIGTRALAETPITTLIIPNSVESIAEGAFSGCSQLETVVIGSGLKKIDTEWVFSSCNKLGTILIAPSNPYYDSRDNCNAIIETATNKLIIGCQNTIIPQTVESIGEHAFWTSNANMLHLNIPDAVTTIEKEAFRNLYKLQSITFGKGMKKAGNHLLIWCYDLQTITVLSDTPFDIEDDTFDNDYSSGTRIYDEITLYVPVGSKINYMTSNGWTRFKHIVEFDPSEIKDAILDNETKKTAFSLSGKQLTAPHKGINIIGGKKVVVR